MERFTREDAERMGAFEETGLDLEDVIKAKELELLIEETMARKKVTDECHSSSLSEL